MEKMNGVISGTERKFSGLNADHESTIGESAAPTQLSGDPDSRRRKMDRFAGAIGTADIEWRTKDLMELLRGEH